jgi:hypothetical protein
MRKNSQNPDPSIPYVLLFNNQVLSANGSQVQFTVPGTTGFRTHSLDVQVPTLALRPAGSYSDYITVEIAPTPSG